MEIADFLGISQSTVSKAIKRFEETGSNEDRPGRGRKKSVRSKRKILRTKGMIKRNPTTKANSARKLDKKLGVDRMSAWTILRKDLKLFPYKYHNYMEMLDQDYTAPAHKANENQDFLRDRCPDFITRDEWPPSSPDLNPLDYTVWSILEEKAYAKPHPTVESLKRALMKAWDEISVETLKKIMDDFPKRLKACVEADGGHFE
uniref:Transposase n=1 Tax=Acrobeloides nanus TaxID=290746 RepID=A0A914EBS3_9BILA